jgi:SAM-dependent methyltransferase
MTASQFIGWDHPATARYYERFCERHDRYQRANRELVKHARLAAGQRVLDLAAGTGRTSEAMIERMGRRLEIVCVEPAAAMRKVGRRRMGRARVRWLRECPGEAGRFDRILCGAAIWQMTPLDATFIQLASLLQAGGWLCFNSPSLYLGHPDPPGGGHDPRLLELAHILAEGAPRTALAPAGQIICADDINRMLRAAALEPHQWKFRVRLSYACYRDWLKIPVMTNHLMPHLRADQRARRIDEAYRQVNGRSWRWECWMGWSARKMSIGKGDAAR